MQSGGSTQAERLLETRLCSNGVMSGVLMQAAGERADRLLVCIHGGGCNGNYFDLKGCSTASLSVERGYAVLLVTRPGYGSNPPMESPAPIASTAPLIRAFIDGVRSEFLPEVDEVVIIGHSIGGAVALTIASNAGDWPLRGIAISGIGDTPRHEIIGLSLPAGKRRIEPPSGLTDALFFSGGEPLSWRAVASLRAAAEPWLVSEVVEVVNRWPVDWPDIAAGIRVPVHLRLAEFERVWTADHDVVERMAQRLNGARHVDAGLLLGGGHLFEVTKRGPEFIRAQLDFLDSCGERSR